MQKQILITVCYLNRKKERQRICAPQKQAWTSKGVDNVLHAQATYLERAFPGREFKFVPLRDGSFNFVETPVEETQQEKLTPSFSHPDVAQASA